MDTTDEEKLRIITMWECGKSTKEIAKSINKSMRTVQRWLLHQRIEGHMQKKERGKRPRKTTPEEDARLVQFVQDNPDLTQKEIITICNVKIYKSTLRRRLQEARMGGLDLDVYKRQKPKSETKLDRCEVAIESRDSEVMPIEDIERPAAFESEGHADLFEYFAPQAVKIEVLPTEVADDEEVEAVYLNVENQVVDSNQNEEIITIEVELPESHNEDDEEFKSCEKRRKRKGKLKTVTMPLWEKNGKDTTDIEKSKIIIMNECGMTISQIARSVKKSRRTIQRWLSKHINGLPMQKKERGKRPRKTTAEEDERIIEFVKANPHLSRKEVMEQCNIKLHKVTLKSRLNEAGIFFNSQGVKILDYSEEPAAHEMVQQEVVDEEPEVVTGYEFNVIPDAGKQEEVLAYNAPMLIYQSAPYSSGQTQTIHYQLLY